MKFRKTAVLTATAMATAALTGAAQAQTNIGSQAPVADLPFNVTTVATFALPWRIAFLPDGRMLVTEKTGPIWLVSQAGDKKPVSNVPAVLLFKPLMAAMADSHREQAWLALAMSSTLAGNLTVLGSVANLIVVESARRSGTTLGFVEYLKVGVPLTILTTLIGVAWLALTHY